MGIPVYVFTGFLESGKTQFIKDTLRDPGFTDKEKTLIVACEDGVEEYDKDFLKSTNSVLLPIEDKSQFNGSLLKKASMMQKPDRILIEYNGMWEIRLIEQEFPRDWDLYQIVTIVNAETYPVYLQNMGPKIIEHIGTSELVVFNRCTPELNKTIRASNVKAMNPRALIYLEDKNGNAEDYNLGLPLPFDIEAPVIEVKDEDFGTWYIDALNDPSRYDGKKIHLKAMVHRRAKDPDDRFAAGRFAMVCCADDISFLGLFCQMEDAVSIVEEQSFADIYASIKVQYEPEYHGNAPVLYIEKYTPAPKPEEDLVYFR